ncbi:MAG TPA: transporter substrate-binding domain-containing protein, partial [Synergistetes bacterium]|nr:transporter substrate-binding domain-containing protein [Synergistota bacterium]
MRIARFMISLLVACLLLTACHSPLLASQPVSIGIYQNKPLIFRDADGVVKGIYADFLNAVAKENDWNIIWVDGTFSEHLERLEKGEIDLMASIAWSEARAERYDFTRKAIISNWGVFYVPRGIAPDSVLGLDGRTIAVVKGDVYYAAFRELALKFGIECFFEEVDDYPDVMIEIESARVQAGLVSRLYGLANEKDFLVERTSLFIDPTELRFAATRDRHMTLLQILDFSLVKMRSDPSSPLNLSVQRWLSANISQEHIPEWVRWVVGLVVGALLIISMVSILLKREVVARTRELLQNRMELAREKTLLERLFEDSPDALVLEGAKGNLILRANRGFTKLFGFTADEARGMTLNELVVPEHLLSEGEELDEIANSGEPVYLETLRRKKDGSLIDVSIVSVPITLDESLFGSYTIYRDITASKNAREVLKENLAKMRRTWEQTIEVLATASETRDPYTAGHQRRVSALAEEIALEMKLDRDRVDSIRMAGLVHDIGKINVPAEILSKPGALGDVEFALIRTHPEIGYEIMKGVDLPWRLADIIRQHHERL